MIYVAKPKGSAPSEFVAAAAEETKKALAYYSKGARPGFKFHAYRNKALKTALENLFRGKCAYCETRYGAASYFEVEHYRPKSYYYWLAAEWNNLLPSCKRCNNGKLSKFPLANGSRPARRRGDERRERPLLLNPSDPRHKPEHHLTFESSTGAIAPVVDRRGRPSPMAVASIEVYRLSRTVLAHERQAWARQVQFLLSLIKSARSAAVARRIEDELLYMAGPDQPYRALTLQVLREAGLGGGSSRRVTRRASPQRRARAP